MGRSEETPPHVNCKFKISTFDLSKLQPNLLAVGSTEGALKLFVIPDEGLEKNLSECKELQSDGGKITVTKFHPHIADVLLTASSDFEAGNYAVNVWDLKEECIRSFPGHGIHKNVILDIAFDHQANLIATTCKDGYARIFCARTEKLFKEWEVAESVKDTTAHFVSSTRILIVGYSKGSCLAVSLWDIANKPKRLSTITVTKGNFTSSSYYDPDTHVLFVTKIGGFSVITYDISDKISVLGTWTSPSGDFMGHCFFTKH
eukprot:TRINITY_DN549_c0_g1_i1.p1 TRINITY_DN549_c0_g1~~TRINITY_DN549_c0_g1_i1.p1  ORF type:complete len:301 (+),score=47.69 TRINITY_DN549_c0_g1_i1:126-905(+)